MDQILTPEVLDITLTYMEGLNCPRSLTVSLLIRNGMWSELFALKAHITDYSFDEDYYRAVCATDFLRKLDTTVDGIDPSAAALHKWKDAEKECFWANRRINEILDFGTLCGSPVSSLMLEFFKSLRRNFVTLVGDSPPVIYDGAFGPGATVSDNSLRTTLPDKMSTIPSLTASAIYHLFPWSETKWGAASAARSDVPKVVRGNEYFTVPKTALTHRSCGKEPSLNAFYQRGLGLVMKGRLRRQGIDLELGKDIHQELARKASLDGSFSTIDLTSASDTLCTALVRACAPHGWFNHLNALRSPYTKVNGKWIRLEKFSSMGNGYTFELETAVFTAICMTVSPSLKPGKDLFVFGDDIIVPTSEASVIINALKFCGFALNRDKTFLTGPFRESCGGDFWEGQAVRPYYLKELPYEPQHFISLANGIKRVLLAFGDNHRLASGLRPAWFRTLDQLPTVVRKCRGPSELGDLVIHDVEEKWTIRWRANCIRYVKVYRPALYRKVRFSIFDPDVQFAAALYGVVLNPQPLYAQDQLSSEKKWLVPRDGVLGYKVGWVPFS